MFAETRTRETWPWFLRSCFVVFLIFSYRAHGGKAKAGLENVENGGPGTVFLYHLVHTHRTLLIDNDGGKPLNKHINYAKLDEEGMDLYLLLTDFHSKLVPSFWINLLWLLGLVGCFLYFGLFVRSCLPTFSTNSIETNAQSCLKCINFLPNGGVPVRYEINLT